MENRQEYVIDMEEAFDFLKLIDIPAMIKNCREKWYNRTLCRVNNSLVRLGIFNEGEFHWHKHELEDEFFFVILGELFIEFENETLELHSHQGVNVPKGAMHRPFVKEPTVVLMVEADSVMPTGD